MKHKLNEDLLNSLLKFDFLILDSNSNKSSTRYKLKTLQLHSSKQSQMTVLEPAEVIKSLKQLTRLLNFLAKKKNPMLYIDSLNNSNFYKHFFDKNIYIINEINTLSQANDFGFYKLYNSLDSYKKLIL